MHALHGNQVFRAVSGATAFNGPFFSWRAWNLGASPALEGAVVCLRVTSTNTDRIWFEAVSSGDSLEGSALHPGQDPLYKVLGVVYNGSIASGASGIIVWGGVAGVLATGIVQLTDPYKLSSNPGEATAATPSEIGRGWCFGLKKGSGSSPKELGFLTPWRF